MSKLSYLKGVTTLRLDSDRCNGCGMCLEVCPHEVFNRVNCLVQIQDRDACMECGACRVNCPSDAIYVNRGVGCATAVLNALLGRTDACCVLDSECGTKGNDFPIYPNCC